jgi:DNA repair exonuclease SbcCD ATPase subunit
MTGPGPDEWVKYLEAVVPSLDPVWLHDPAALLLPIDDCPTEFRELIEDKNKSIRKSIRAYANAAAKSHNSRKLTIHKVRWDNVLCYGEGNFFDFNVLDGKIAVLNGSNASGKSSFLDVICLGLFGAPTTMRTMVQTKGSQGVACLSNKNRPTSSPMTVAIMFSIDAHLFEIIRTFKGVTKTAIVNNLSTTPVPYVEGITLVDTWIEDNIGTVEDILMSNIICQVDLENFLYMKNEEQKGIIDRVLNLSKITAYGKIIKDSCTAHTFIVGALKTALAAVDAMVNADFSKDSANKTVQKLHERSAKLHDTVESLQRRRDELVHTGGFMDGRHNTGHCATDDKAALQKRLSKASKALAAFSDLTEADKAKASVLKSDQYAKWNQLQERRQLVGDPDPATDTDIEAIDATLSDLDARLIALNSEKPDRQMSDDMLSCKKAEYDSWMKRQNPGFINDPDKLLVDKEELADELESLLEKHAALLPCARPIEQEPTEPQLDHVTASISELQKLQRDLENQVHVKQVEYAKYETLRGTLSYEEWLRCHDDWVHKTRRFNKPDALKEMEERLADYQTYIDTVESKKYAQDCLFKQLTELDEEVAELAGLPFNPECWACQKQPMQIRKTSLQDKAAVVKKGIGKIHKYLEKMGLTNDKLDAELCTKKAEAEKVRENLKHIRAYEATAPKMQADREAWENSNRLHAEIVGLEARIKQIRETIVYSKWQAYNVYTKRVDALMAKILPLEKELGEINEFLSKFPRYSELRENIVEEERARACLAEWTDAMVDIEARIDELSIQRDRLVLASEIEELRSMIDGDSAVMTRLQEWQTTEAAVSDLRTQLNHAEYIETDQALKTVNAEYIDVRSRIISIEKDTRDHAESASTRARYTELLRMCEGRRQSLAVLEEKFMGDRTTSDGIREFLYKSHIIPLLEKTINEFLELACENLRVSIEYASKTLTLALSTSPNIATPSLNGSMNMASGYQRFIVGLAVRAALAKIGAVGHNLQHFFIDEGFAAWDAANLGRAATVLKALKEFVGYHDIILMSHTDANNTLADTIINISAIEGCASVLRWGAAYPASPTKPVKKRTKKAMVT